MAQATAFDAEITSLKSGKPLPKRNASRKLAPILDKNGILRVGGRLANSKLPRDLKNPPILPHSSMLTLTASIVMHQAWILSRKRLIKTVIHNCITCQRVKPRMAHQLMGDLRAAQVKPTRLFSTAGLDYAGPIQVRITKGHGHKSYKGYIVLFVCFVTRAIHLKNGSNRISVAFIGGYRRFVSRRSICRN